jgi:hypothetical protein
MESRLIYESSKTYLHKINWIRPIESPESEWIHFINNGEINKNLVLLSIEEHLNDSKIYVVKTRKNSLEINKEAFNFHIILSLGKIDFIIWNASFNRAIEFNTIGVMRKGIIEERSEET